jgi:hypothetical protein
VCSKPSDTESAKRAYGGGRGGGERVAKLLSGEGSEREWGERMGNYTLRMTRVAAAVNANRARRYIDGSRGGCFFSAAP